MVFRPFSPTTQKRKNKTPGILLKWEGRVRRTFLILFCSPQIKILYFWYYSSQSFIPLSQSTAVGKGQFSRLLKKIQRVGAWEWPPKTKNKKQQKAKQKGICKTLGRPCVSSLQEYKHICMGWFFFPQRVRTAALHTFYHERPP